MLVHETPLSIMVSFTVVPAKHGLMNSNLVRRGAILDNREPCFVLFCGFGFLLAWKLRAINVGYK